MVKDAREFLLAIKMSTHTTFDADAVDFLELLRTGVSQSLDAAGATGPERDSVLFFEGMLRGTQIKLIAAGQQAKGRLNAMGLLNGDGEPKIPEM